MLVALAGPMVNFVLMGIGWTIMSFTVEYPEWFQMALSLYMINAVLMIFNLIPIPPLDGSRIIGGFLPNNIALYWQRLDPYGMLLVVGLYIGETIFLGCKVNMYLLIWFEGGFFI